MVKYDDDLQPMTQPGGVLIPFPPESGYQRDRGFVVLRESGYDAVYGFVAFSRAEEVFWSDDSSIGWFPYS